MAAALTPLRIWLKDLFVLLLSMIPIAENRLAIPVAAALRLKCSRRSSARRRQLPARCPM